MQKRSHNSPNISTCLVYTGVEGGGGGGDPHFLAGGGGGGGGGGGVAPLFGLEGCVPLNRVWFSGIGGIQFHY